jgi:hypothetical protein
MDKVKTFYFSNIYRWIKFLQNYTNTVVWNGGMLQYPSWVLWHSQLFKRRYNQFHQKKIITFLYKLEWKSTLYKNCSIRWDLQLWSSNYFHLNHLDAQIVGILWRSEIWILNLNIVFEHQNEFNGHNSNYKVVDLVEI